MGDTHEGTILKHKKGMKEMIGMVLKDTDAYVVHHGDLVEGRTIDDPKYSSDTADVNTPTPLRQYRAAAEELMPIADRILAILYGNHDLYTQRFGNCVRDIVCRDIAGDRDPDTIYGSYSCKLIIKDKKGKLMYKHFATHGRRFLGSTADDPIRQVANMKLQLKRHLANKAGDCVVQSRGHSHKLLIAEPTPSLYLTDDGKRPVQRYTKSAQTQDYIHPSLRWYVNAGCFYRLYGEDGVSGYAEQAEYDPTELGFAIMNVEDGNIKSIEKVVM